MKRYAVARHVEVVNSYYKGNKFGRETFRTLKFMVDIIYDNTSTLGYQNLRNKKQL